MFVEIFFKLLIGHAVADFWAQSENMRRAKGWINDVRSDGLKVWPYVLTAHCLILGGAVWVITSSFELALAEFALHWLIDYGKCSGWYRIHVDQGLHIFCKIIWAALA